MIALGNCPSIKLSRHFEIIYDYFVRFIFLIFYSNRIDFVKNQIILNATMVGLEVFLMAKQKRCRRICRTPEFVLFAPKPRNSSKQEVILNVDEYEVIRLIDLEQRTHEQAATQMAISRTTVTEIYHHARMKLADTLVNGKSLRIDGGNYCLCEGFLSTCYRDVCWHQQEQ